MNNKSIIMIIILRVLPVVYISANANTDDTDATVNTKPTVYHITELQALRTVHRYVDYSQFRDVVGQNLLQKNLMTDK